MGGELQPGGGGGAWRRSGGRLVRGSKWGFAAAESSGAAAQWSLKGNRLFGADFVGHTFVSMACDLLVSTEQCRFTSQHLSAHGLWARRLHVRRGSAPEHDHAGNPRRGFSSYTQLVGKRLVETRKYMPIGMCSHRATTACVTISVGSCPP